MRIALAVDHQLLRFCNLAFAEAKALGSPHVEVAHLVSIILREARGRLVLSDANFDLRRLEAETYAWLSAQPSSGAAENSATSRELLIVLRKSERHALRLGSNAASLEDLVGVLRDECADLPFVRRLIYSSLRGDLATSVGRSAASQTTTGHLRDLPDTARGPHSARAREVLASVRVDQQRLHEGPPSVHRQRLGSHHLSDAGGLHCDREAKRTSIVESYSTATRHLPPGEPDARPMEGDVRMLSRLVAAQTAALDALATTVAGLVELARLPEHRRQQNGQRWGLRTQWLRVSPVRSSGDRAEAIGRRAQRRRLRWDDIDRLGRELAAEPAVEAGDPEGLDDGTVQTKRFYLVPTDAIVNAPSIGPKTAARLNSVGIDIVRDLLDGDAEQIAQSLNVRHITAARIRNWQSQARLVCTVPWLRGTHAQLLVGAGYDTLDKLVGSDPVALSAAILRFASTTEGQGVLRSGPVPDVTRVQIWLGHAAAAEPRRAA